MVWPPGGTCYLHGWQLTLPRSSSRPSPGVRWRDERAYRMRLGMWGLSHAIPCWGFIGRVGGCYFHFSRLNHVSCVLLDWFVTEMNRESCTIMYLISMKQGLDPTLDVVLRQQCFLIHVVGSPTVLPDWISRCRWRRTGKWHWPRPRGTDAHLSWSS